MAFQSNRSEPSLARNGAYAESAPAMTTAAPLPAELPKRLLRPTDLAALLAVSVKTLDRLRAARKIGPTVIRLSSQALRFDPAEVTAWLAHRDRSGQLYDEESWPAVWQQLQRSAKT